ncbi:aminopeptidase P family protein [Endozoicomonas sp. GU-1]|uniref:aminopeptidase P family protein n=1 Tax=Endozoicomonas sp. GU-1 TaxID=3009078 RepID=UPI0022B4758A|nr:aminopeptidase P family protein [Endozoicomonas sp. GU-1]WBA81639.1 aminopeptidase P family protein [Endozoicomonas sp. GU-1]WBA84592.1 aminopeptidase P family protein [Endozoicomonas sp. GU-1]
MVNTPNRSDSTKSPKSTKKLQDLRGAMTEYGIDVWIIPSSDAHNSEYVAPHWEGRAWLSGFTGSAGTLVVTQDKAALWTDGRYFIQASEQLAGSEITLMKDGQPGVPSMVDWVTEAVSEQGCIGFDGATLSLSHVRNLEKKLAAKSVTLKFDHDLLNDIWTDRPARPAEPVFIHQDTYAGKTLTEKVTEVREILKERKATELLITTLDDIAWLFNLRGSDIDCNPVFLAYALISPDSITLFTNKERIAADALSALAKAGVELAAYDEVLDRLSTLADNTHLMINPATTGYQLASAIPAPIHLIEDRLPTTDLKAIKNSTEIERMKECHRRDGAAMVRFIRWLESNIPTGQLNEVNIDEQLLQFRSESEHFQGVSFPSIVGYAAHGAICHYRADAESAYSIQTKGLLLIDSGAQYPDGTTDITRTFACGEMTDEEKRDYTLVMKSHIALATARFKEGTRGIQLDAITRQPLWSEGIDFNHGTGHGVGYFLNVHEGPQSISPRWFDVALKPGMLVTNEPGIYRDNKHGVRLENIMLIAEDIENEFGKFYKLIPMTLAPFDTRPLLKDLMTDTEINWLNGYHEMVREALSPELQGQDFEWLREATQSL